MIQNQIRKYLVNEFFDRCKRSESFYNGMLVCSIILFIQMINKIIKFIIILLYIVICCIVLSNLSIDRNRCSIFGQGVLRKHQTVEQQYNEEDQE